MGYRQNSEWVTGRTTNGLEAEQLMGSSRTMNGLQAEQRRMGYRQNNDEWVTGRTTTNGLQAEQRTGETEKV